MASIRSPITRCVTVATATIAAYLILPLRGEYTWAGIGLSIALLAVAIPVIWKVLGKVNQPHRPVSEPLAFLATVGTLSIVVPAASYVIAADVAPGSFEGLHTKIDGLYFAVTVASTVGFGDIHPVSQGARLLTTAHILASIIVLGSVLKMVARVVGVRVTERHQSDGPG